MVMPKLRFRQDNGTEYPVWEEKKLGDIGEVAMCKRVLKEQTSSSGDVPFFKISTFGSFPDAYISFDLYNELRTLYRFPQKGAVLISAAGTIGRIVRYNGENAYYQDSNIVWLEHDDKITDNYLYHFYSQVAWDNLEGGTVKRLYNKLLLDTRIFLPCLEEQQKIADFLSDLDAVISASEAEVAALEQQKKGAMQKIFSQEVRFRRDDGIEYPAWIIFPMSDLIYASGKRNSDNADLETYSVNNEKGFIPQSEQFDAAGYLENTNKKLYYIVSPGSFAYNPARINVGSIGYLETNHNVLVSSLYEVFRTYDRLNDKFLWYWFHSNAFQKAVRKYSEGGVRQYFFFDKMLEIRFALPCLEEQQKIADFLSSFDAAIALARQELERWKLLKKGLMQQMFV